MTDLPLYTEPLIGYRSWGVSDDLSFHARITQVPWRHDGATRAECRPPKFHEDQGQVLKVKHTAPHGDCVCGLYAFHEVYDALDSGYHTHSKAVLGAAIFWGEIEVCTAGFRAQYGRIVAVSDIPFGGRVHDLAWPGQLDKAAARYGIPVVPKNLLQRYAETFGQSFGADYLDD